MTYEEAFLHSILEKPDDDAPRLIYADWLEESGDPRGEFIRVQCALARPDLDEGHRRELQRREQVLLATYEQEWLEPLCSPRLSWRFHRGFIASMQGMFRERAGKFTDYIRFFPSGQVRVLTRVGATPPEAADLLTETGCQHHYEGRYDLLPRTDRMDVVFSVTGQRPAVISVPRFGQAPPFLADVSEPGTIDFSGTIQRERLRLSWHRHTNGRRGRKKYRLTLRPDGTPW
jgi:uncharacterized protein (TIGR02996 family)